MTQEKFPAPAYTASVLRDVFEDAKRLFVEPLIEVDLAHAVMLAEQGIITDDEARSLLKAVSEIDRERIQKASLTAVAKTSFSLSKRSSRRFAATTSRGVCTQRGHATILMSPFIVCVCATMR